MENSTGKRKKKAGFTLVELIAVMSILAVLLTLAVPQMMGYIRGAHRTAARTEAQITADAVQRYLDDQMEKGKGTLSGSQIWKLMNLEINDPQGVLKNYMSGGQEGARIVKVNVDMKKGRLLAMEYETKYSRVKLTIDKDGNRVLEEVED